MTCPWQYPQLGSSLLEAVIAAGLLATVLTGVLPLVTASWIATEATRLERTAAHLARQRLAHLQTLAYVHTAAGVIADAQSALDQAEPFAPGGPGLTASGLTPLERSTSPWVDWLDGHGGWQAAGVLPPPGTRFRRRWGILTTGGQRCLQLWVEVTPLGRAPGQGVVHDASLQCPWGVGAP